MGGGGGSGTRSGLSSCLRKEISFLKTSSLFLSWSSSDRNSWHISEIIVMDKVSVFLFVAMIEPPREVSSGIDTMSTGGSGGVFRTYWVVFLLLGHRLDLELLKLFERVDMVVLGLKIDFG